MLTAQLERLQAAAVDGRAQNVYFRQTQLERLCNGLLAEEAALRQAMISDSDYTSSEAIAVLHATIQTVKDLYATLEPKQALEKEYRVAHGKDAGDGERPFGLVYIEPEAHTLLYSLCAPLSAVIAAGNCVAVLLENNLRELPGLIRRVLVNALDADTFTIVTSPVKDSVFLDSAFIVGRETDRTWPRINELLSPSQSLAVAVVDRTADVGVAAREVALAKLAFDSRSPYGPDTVLVNEFVMEDFLQALQVEFGTHTSSDSKQQLPQKKSAEELIKVDLRAGTWTATKSASGLSQALQTKTQEPILFVQPVRSLDDAINLLGEHRKGSSYLAAFHFCNLRSAKYLSQFVDAEVTFVNRIPRQLLIGPAAPRCHGFDLRHRYHISLFSQRRPAFVQSPTGSHTLAAALFSEDNASAQELLQQAKQSLKAMKRSKGGGVGFFEQGILLGVSFILVSIATVSAAGAWQIWKYRSSRQ